MIVFNAIIKDFGVTKVFVSAAFGKAKKGMG